MKEDVIVLYDWLRISDIPRKADIIFLVGGGSLATPRNGLELFRQRLAQCIVCTGNTGTGDDSGWNKPIADVFAEYLIKKGLKKNMLFIQNESTNTLDDINLTMSRLIKLNIPCHSVILIARPFHQRRAWATFKKQFPKIQIINAPGDESHPVNLEGQELRNIGVKCLGEYQKIIEYGQKKDLVAQIIPESVSRAAQKLQSSL